MVIGITISATAGYALSRFNFPGKRAADVGLPGDPDVPGGHPDRADLQHPGELGLIDTKASLVIAYCTVAVPFCAWMLRGYFDTIPRELDEAGRARRARALRYLLAA